MATETKSDIAIVFADIAGILVNLVFVFIKPPEIRGGQLPQQAS
jgi:hypothetical protein